MPIDDYWERTHDKVGFRPLFKIDCGYCEESMVLRSSRLYKMVRHILQPASLVNGMRYKCPSCGLVIQFHIPCDIEYFRETLQKRAYSLLYHPPIEEWSEDERIASQLSGLGYFGGMDGVDEKELTRKDA